MDTTTWWDPTSLRYEQSTHALAHINKRVDSNGDKYDNFHKALFCLARGLPADNRFLVSNDDDRGEGGAVSNLVSQASKLYLTDKFYDGSAFRALLTLDPPVYNVYEVFKEKRRSPTRSEHEIIKEQSKDHLRLRKEVDLFDLRRNVANREKVGSVLGGLLYLIRCNISHGHKMSFGGNLTNKIIRDEMVTDHGLRVLRQIIEKLLGEPQHRLAVYGSLRSCHENHELIADLGDPDVGSVVGMINMAGDYPVFRWASDGQDIPVEIYRSPKLTPQRLRKLDEFEGNSYRRMFIPVRLTDGSFQVSTIYAENARSSFEL